MHYDICLMCAASGRGAVEIDASATSLVSSTNYAYASFPVDVVVYIRIQPSFIRFTCLPVSRVECLLRLPSVDVVFSSTKADLDSPANDSSFTSSKSSGICCVLVCDFLSCAYVQHLLQLVRNIVACEMCKLFLNSCNIIVCLCCFLQFRPFRVVFLFLFSTCLFVIDFRHLLIVLWWSCYLSSISDHPGAAFLWYWMSFYKLS